MDNAKGIFLGFLLWVILIATISTISSIFPVEVNEISGVKQHVLYSGPAMQWSWIGTLPVCIALGQYLSAGKGMGRKVAYNLLFSSAVVFIIWLAIIAVIPYADISLSFEMVVAGGYLLLFAVWIGMRIRGIPIKKNDDNNSLKERKALSRCRSPL